MSAARHRRRAQVRGIRRELGEQGCTCNPPVTTANRDPLVHAVEAIIGRRTRGAFDVIHEPWCSAGQAHRACFDAGVLPVVVFTSGPECQR